jgi:carbonic anhydrase
MHDHKTTRRRLLASAAGVGLGLAAPPLAWADDPKPRPEEPPPKDAKEALQRLVAGNKRFVAGESAHGHTSKEWRKGLVGGQQPFAAVLGCSDSRVIPELVFD